LPRSQPVFEQLDSLRAEEKELVDACEQITAEERTVLENANDSSEKQAVDKLLRIRATRDVRAAKLANMQKRIALHVDLLIHDLGNELRHSMSNLAYALLAARTTRIEALFISLIGVPYDHGLPVNAQDLTRVSKPVQEIQRLANWIRRESRPSAEEELAELRSEVPRRWLSELRAIIQEETNEPGPSR
jgi:hypothetical protein